MSNLGDTVDPKEIVFFNNLKWWNSVTPLHALNKLRVPFVRDGLIASGLVKEEFIDNSNPLKGLDVLEVGCGGGILSESLSTLGCNLTAIDVGLESIEVAKHHASLNPSLTNLTYLCESIEDHVTKNYEKYDAVVASEVVEHVNEPGVFLEICIKCLKPGGSIFITTFNKTWFAWLYGIIFAEYIWGFIPLGTHTWDKFISPEDIEKILETANCKTTFVRGMMYNFVAKEWFWWASSSVVYGLQAVKRYD